MNKEQGIVIGDEANGGLRLTLNVMCSNETMAEKELSVVLNTGLHLTANITWDNFVYWAELGEPMFEQTTCESKVEGLKLDWHNWDSELTYVMKDIADDFNLKHATPVDLKEKSMTIKMAAGLIPDSLVSPFVADEFLFIGTKSITDK